MVNDLLSLRRFRRRGARAVASVGLALLLAALACNFPGQGPTPKAPESTRTATIKEVVGQASLRQTTDGPETPVDLDQLVPAGAQLGTKGGSQVKIGLPEAGSFVRLGEDSTLTVLELSSKDSGPVSRFGLLQGKTWIVLGSSGGGEATVETPGGTANGNGQMSVEYYSNFAGTGAPLFLVTCLQGVCSVSNPFGGVALTPGQQTEVAGSNTGPTEPHPMDPEQQSDWEKNNPELTGGGEAVPTVTGTATVTETLAPGVTPPTATFTPTATLTPTPTPLGPPCVIVTTDANIRTGPGTVYGILGVKQAGETAEVIGKDQTQTWYVIVYPQSPDGRGWIWGNLVTLCGDHSNVPIVPAPPTPTYTPTATATITPTFTPSFTPSFTPTTTGTVYPQPSIIANPNPVTAGCDLTNTNLSWSAPGAGSATLNGERSTVPTGKKAVCVLQETVFTLIAKYADGSTQQVSVTVKVAFSSTP